jgi:hypothetical protein
LASAKLRLTTLQRSLLRRTANPCQTLADASAHAVQPLTKPLQLLRGTHLLGILLLRQGSLLRGSLANGLSRFLSPSAGVSSVGVSIGVAYEATERARLSSGASDGASDCASHDAVSLEPSADHQTTMHLPDRALREALAGAVSEDTLLDTQSPAPTAAAAGDPVAGRTSGGSPSGGGTGNGSRGTGTGEAEADDDREWRCARGSGVLCGPHAGKSLGERQRQAGVRRAHPSASPSIHMLTTALSLLSRADSKANKGPTAASVIASKHQAC